MLSTLRTCIRMLPQRMRRRWLWLVPLAMVTGVAEWVAAAGIFVVILFLTDPARAMGDPRIAWLVAWLPWRTSREVLLELIGLLAVYYIAKSGLELWVQYLRLRVSHDAAANLACGMLRRYLAAPYPFHFRRNSAELMRNCTSSVTEMVAGVLGATVSVVTELLMAAGVIAVLIRTSPGGSIVAALGLLVVMVLLLKFTRAIAGRRGSELHELSAEMVRTLQHALGGIKEVKVLGREGYFYEKFAERQRQYLLLGYLGITLGSVPATVLQTVLLCGALALIAILTVFGRAGVETLPVASVFGYAALRILPTTHNVVLTVNGLRGSRRAVDELYEDFRTLERWEKGRGAEETSHLAFTRSIALEDVSYTYPGSESSALNNVSLTIRRGESIGVVGPTGAGKSTLVDLILGLLPPTHGRVTVDGIEIAAAAAPWRRRVGYVPQTLFLIDDSLRRNIALGIRDADIDERRIGEVIGMAQLEPFVTSLQDGLDTRVGERGIRLSGGERQRVAIARALYHDPDLIVFDEATSWLDLATEAEVNRTIDALRSVKTMVVIAHRLSSVKGCDRLVWLQRGSVAGLGSFEDLRRRSTEFEALTSLATV